MPEDGLSNGRGRTPALTLASPTSDSWHAGRDSLPQIAGTVGLLGYQTKSDRVVSRFPSPLPAHLRVHHTGRSTR